jgi:acetyl esterase/lipase
MKLNLVLLMAVALSVSASAQAQVVAVQTPEQPKVGEAKPVKAEKPAARVKERPKRATASAPGVDVTNGVVFGDGGGRALKLDIVRPKVAPEMPMPVVIWIHGGGWRGGNSKGGIPRLMPFAERGYFCASLEYRLSGEAVFPAQIEDVKCAIRFLRSKAKEYHLDPDRIGVWGGSAGGHLAALLGTAGDVAELEGKGGHQNFSSRVAAVCNWFGPADMVRMLETSNANGLDAVSKLIGGSLAEKKETAVKASPLTYVTRDDPPFLIMHGGKDTTVPVQQSELLHAALEKAGVTSTRHVYPDQGHGFNGPEYDKLVHAFFDLHLKPR